jgi:hypothetical protein
MRVCPLSSENMHASTLISLCDHAHASHDRSTLYQDHCGYTTPRYLLGYRRPNNLYSLDVCRKRRLASDVCVGLLKSQHRAARSENLVMISTIFLHTYLVVFLDLRCWHIMKKSWWFQLISLVHICYVDLFGSQQPYRNMEKTSSSFQLLSL